MLRWLLALLLIPFLDAILLGGLIVWVDVLGLVEMVAIVVLTGLVGLILVRAEGRRTLRKIQTSLEAGRPPTNELLDGALLLVSGAFLLTPGLVTDLIGFLLVIPLTRIPIRMGLKRWVIVPYVDERTGGFTTGTVWTHGFPDGTDPFDDAAGRDGETVNLGRDEYDVAEDGYTIEFGDERTTDESDRSSTDDTGGEDGQDDQKSR